MLDSTIAPTAAKSTSFVNLSPSEAHIYDRARYFARLGKKAGVPLRPKQLQPFLRQLDDTQIIGSFFATVPKLAKGASGPNKRYSDRQTQRALSSLRQKRLCSLYDVTARGVRVYLLYTRPIGEDLADKLEHQWILRTGRPAAFSSLSPAENVTARCQDVTHIIDPDLLVLGSKTSTYTVSAQSPDPAKVPKSEGNLEPRSVVGVFSDPSQGTQQAPPTAPEHCAKPASQAQPERSRIGRWRSCDCGTCEQCRLESEVLQAKRRYCLPSRLVDQFRHRTDPALDAALLRQLLDGVKAVERSYAHRPDRLRNFGRCLLRAIAEDWSTTFAALDAEAAAAAAAARKPRAAPMPQELSAIDLPSLPPTFSDLLDRLDLPANERAAWFGVVTASVEAGRLVIKTPSSYVTDWICSNYLTQIRLLDTGLDIEVLTDDTA